MPTLKEIREKLQQLESRGSSESDNSIYPFWNMPDDKTAIVRFLPDGNESNTFFWAERQIIRIPFKTVIGSDKTNVNVQVPCVEMWGDTCPIHQEIRPWFNDATLSDLAKQYWKKRSYIFQGFVRTNPLADDVTPENPIRRFVMGRQVCNIITSSLLDPDIEYLPTDYVRGVDFKILKGKKGTYADYSGSGWSRRETELTDEELAAIEKWGLNNLSDFLPKKPSEEQKVAIRELFQASIDGEPYDPSRWEHLYKPYGVDFGVTKSSEPKVQVQVPKAVKPSVTEDETDDIPFDVDPAPVSEPKPAPEARSSEPKSADDILKMIRSHRNK